MKHIKAIIALFLSIFGKAVTRTIVDEVVKYAYSEGEKPLTKRQATVNAGKAVRHAYPDPPKVPPFDYDKAGYHDVVLVAFDVLGPNASIVHEWLHNQMPKPGDHAARGDNDETVAVNLDAWWIAEDDSYDSVCDSAVFVPKGDQAAARGVLLRAGFGLGR